MKLKHQIAMVASLVFLAGCSEKDSTLGSDQSNMPAPTKAPASSASAPAVPAVPTPPPGPTNAGAASALTNTDKPEAK
ncbi:MAG TPA: hypothetical protein VJA21_03955 [Verrucomicrobiae bacterium]